MSPDCVPLGERKYYYRVHFTEDKTEAQRGTVTYPRTLVGRTWVSNPGRSGPKSPQVDMCTPILQMRKLRHRKVSATCPNAGWEIFPLRSLRMWVWLGFLSCPLSWLLQELPSEPGVISGSFHLSPEKVPKWCRQRQEAGSPDI